MVDALIDASAAACCNRCRMRPSRCLDFGGCAVVGRRQQFQHGRAAPEQFRFGGLALGQLRGVELPDQSPDLQLEVFAGVHDGLPGQNDANQQADNESWPDVPGPLICIVRCSSRDRQPRNSPPRRTAKS